MVSIRYSPDVTWGTTSLGVIAFGKILSASRKMTNKQFEQTNENGELHSLILYDQREEFSMEILARATQARPILGSTITLDGVVSLIITEVDISWKNTDTIKYNVTAWKSVA